MPGHLAVLLVAVMMVSMVYGVTLTFLIAAPADIYNQP